MNLKELTIPASVPGFVRRNRIHFETFESANAIIRELSGIIDFFNSNEQLKELNSLVSKTDNIVREPDRREYGDFQTNKDLADKSVQYVLSRFPNTYFDCLIEPTCGKGNFILAAITRIETFKKVIGIEIYQPYIWETKFKILDYFLRNQHRKKPEIEIVHTNIFEYNFEYLAHKTSSCTSLVIGNPPWVTNSELGSIDSKNLPQKTNFKKHNGIDAITGKGNFDIGEYIALMILRHFSQHNGCFGFLIKNSVVKNLIHDQYRNNFRIGVIEKLNINSRKEFNVSVGASFFITKLNYQPEYTCTELDFYNKTEKTIFGWSNGHYVYSIADYLAARAIEGKSQFVWRQGVKHDCSKIMELEDFKGHYKNGLGQEIELESGLVYGLIKSSDLKAEQTNIYRKSTIITQKKIGQETSYIKQQFPRTYEYLQKNKKFFDERKSSIYKGKPDFSIFGIGDYSFMPYKVCISGLYKSTHFTLVLPKDGKPIMLDDTCYFIGFEAISNARIAQYLLNNEHTQRFLRAIIFPDSKRSVTKEVLMRIDLKKLYDLSEFGLVQRNLESLRSEDWKKFGNLIQQKKEIEQMTLF